MKTCSAFPFPAFAILAALTCATPPLVSAADSGDSANALSKKEAAAGFTLLFDGKKLDDKWQHSGNWAVENGALTRTKKGGSLVWNGATIPDDFELRFDWKVAKRSNSGVYYRPGQYEYQILDNSEHPDGGNPRTSAASLYFCVAPSRDLTRPVGEWNAARIVCKGTVIQHWLNGEKVIDFDYADPKNAEAVELLRLRGADLKARGGKLSLQDHGDPVWYRSLKLRAIPAAEAIEHGDVTPAVIPPAALEKERKILEHIRKRREAQRKAAGAK